MVTDDGWFGLFLVLWGLGGQDGSSQGPPMRKGRGLVQGPALKSIGGCGAKAPMEVDAG